MNVELVKVLLLGWLTIFSLLWLYSESQRRKWLYFLRKEPIATLEQKIVSFDEALNAKIITDANGIISSANAAARELFGYSRLAMVNKNISILVPERERAKLIGSLQEMRVEGAKTKLFLIDAITQGKAEISTEMTIRKKLIDNSFFFLFILKDRSKEIRTIKMLEQIIDVQKITLNVLSKGEALGHTGSWIWDIKKGMLTTSKGYKIIMGLDERVQEFDAAYLRNKVVDEDDKIVSEAVENAFKGQGYDITYRAKRSADFKIIKIRSIAEPIVNENGNVTYIYGSMRLIEAVDIVMPSLK